MAETRRNVTAEALWLLWENQDRAMHAQEIADALGVDMYKVRGLLYNKSQWRRELVQTADSTFRWLGAMAPA